MITFIMNKMSYDKMMTEKPEERFCSHCGFEMEINLRSAETVNLGYEGIYLFAGSAYNEVTGKRNFVYEYICPNWKKKIFFSSKHDNYCLSKIVNYK